MDTDDLMKLLDLDGADSAPASGIKIEQGAGQQAGPSRYAAHSTAFRLDKWSLKRGADCLERNPDVKRLPLGTNETVSNAMADFHAAAFEPDLDLNDGCSDRQRHEFLKTMLETPDYKALRASTMLNLAASELAAVKFAQEFAKVKGSDDEMKRLRAVNQATRQAAQEVEEMEEAVQSLGGTAPGRGCSGPQDLDPRKVLQTYRAVRHNHYLKRICELAGRFRRLAQAKQRQKANHGQDDVVGVIPDDKVERMLPFELAALCDPDLELDAMRRFAEKQSACQERKGVERVAKGPVIVCIDESSSMTGEPICTAKALALAMAWIARHQRRWCALCAWSSPRSNRRTIALPPARWDEAAIMAWLSCFLSGGTEPPLYQMPEIYAATKAPIGKTDILMITDGQCWVDPEETAFFLNWKKQARAKMTTIGIGCDPGSLREVSDEVHTVSGITVDDPAIGKCLSI